MIIRRRKTMANPIAAEIFSNTMHWMLKLQYFLATILSRIYNMTGFSYWYILPYRKERQLCHSIYRFVSLGTTMDGMEQYAQLQAAILPACVLQMLPILHIVFLHALLHGLCGIILTRFMTAIFEYFYGDITENKSLCIAYAKQVPFVEDTRRVVVGIGHVKNHSGGWT